VRVDGCDVRILGTIAGFVPDGDRVRRAYEAERPDAVALGVPPEDLEGLDALAADPTTPVPDIDPQSERLFGLLARFGATRVPSPDLEAAHGQARGDGVPIVPLDMDDETHSGLYIRLVGFRHAVRSGRILRKIMEADFSRPEDPYGLAVAWDAYQNQLKPLQALEAAREEHMAKRLREALDGRNRVLALVPAARFEGVLAALEREARGSSDPTPS